MKCGNCDKTDGRCYLSDPPKVKCTITDQFHFYDDECNALGTVKTSPTKYAVLCILCGEVVRYTDYPIYTYMEVCDKCKAAVMHIREKLERDPLQPILD